MAKIGVFVCGWGFNISDKLSITELPEFSGSLEGVAEAKSHGLLCSAGSPKEHEKTFREALDRAGQYLGEKVLHFRKEVSNRYSRQAGIKGGRPWPRG